MFDSIRLSIHRAAWIFGGVIALGMIAHAMGALPAAWMTWSRPLLSLTLGLMLLAGLMPEMARLVRATRLRWSKRVLLVLLAALVAAKVSEAVIAGDEAMVTLGGLTILSLPVAGAALLADAWEGWLSRSLPRIGVMGAVAAGVGLILFMSAGLSDRHAFPLLVSGLAGIIAGGLAGSFSLRQIERAEAGLITPADFVAGPAASPGATSAERR